MAKVLVVYYSQTGNTEKMANSVLEGVKKERVEVELKRAEDTTPDDLLASDGIIIGSPTYYGTMAWQLKKLIDDSVKYHGQMDGKVGGAFTSSGNLGGGNETTLTSILEAMLVQGMVVPGYSSGGHYGPVAVGTPNQKALGECARLGQSVAKLVNSLH